MATSAVLPLPSISLTATPQPPSLRPRVSRRRTTPQQGRALELLGHAIEYLVDSRLEEGGPGAAESRAIHMLMTCSRNVFEDCAEIVPVHQRVQGWVQGRFRKRHA